MINIIKFLQDNFDINYNELPNLYPKLKERIIPLSATSVTPRIFYHWRRKGIIDYPISKEGREWVKLNMFEYVWICVCVILRNYGVSLANIKEIKDEIFVDFYQELLNDKPKFFKRLKQNLQIKDQLSPSDINDFLTLFEHESNNIPEEYKVFKTILGGALNAILLSNSEASLMIQDDKGELKIFLVVYKTLDQLYSYINPYLHRPLLMVPFRSIVSDFLKESDNDYYLKSFELLTLDERKILTALRSNDFKSIEIKRSHDKNDVTVHKDFEFDIKGEKVKDIKIMMGLNDYDTIKLVLRNDKHLYAVVRKKI